MQNEWLIFTVVVAMISAFFLVYNPLRNAAKERENEKSRRQEEQMRASVENTKAMTELNMTMKLLGDNLRSFKDDNTRSHKEFYDRLDKKGRELSVHAEKLEEHERRLTKLEEKE